MEDRRQNPEHRWPLVVDVSFYGSCGLLLAIAAVCLYYGWSMA